MQVQSYPDEAPLDTVSFLHPVERASVLQHRVSGSFRFRLDGYATFHLNDVVHACKHSH